MSRRFVGIARGGEDDALRGRLSQLVYRIISHSEVVGHGRDDFDGSAVRLMSGEAHRVAGAPLTLDGRWLGTGSDAPLAAGDAVKVHPLGTPLPALVSPCLVLSAETSPTHAEMVYGTLPGHVECGEECFSVVLRADGTVTVSVGAFSRPASPITRLGGPVARTIQRRMTARYVKAIGGIR